MIEDLPQPSGVAVQQVGQARVEAGIQPQAFALGAGGVAVQAVFDQVQGAERRRLEGHLPSVDLRHIQHVADQLEQGAGGALNGVQVILLATVQGRQADQLEGVQDAVQRGAYFMAHGGQEQGLGLAGRACRTLGLCHQGRVFEARGHVVEGAQQHLLALVATGHKAHLQRAAVDFNLGFAGVGPLRIAVEQRHQFCRALPRLGLAIFQQHLAVASAHHAQAGGRGVDQHLAEGLAVGDALLGLSRRDEDPLAVPAAGPPTADQGDQPQPPQAYAGPPCITEVVAVAEAVQRDPRVGGVAGDLVGQAVQPQVQAFVQALGGRARAHQDLAGGGDQGEVVVHRTGHQPLDVIGVIQVQQRRQHHPPSVAQGVQVLVLQVQLDVRQHVEPGVFACRWCVGFPLHRVARGAIARHQPMAQPPLQHLGIGFACRARMALWWAGHRHAEVEAAVAVEQHTAWRRVRGSRPEGPVQVRQVQAGGEDLGQLAGRWLLRVDVQAEGAGVGRWRVLPCARPLSGGRALRVKSPLVVPACGVGGLLRCGVPEETLLFMDVFHQVGEVQPGAAVLFVEQALGAPVEDGEERQGQPQHGQQAPVQVH